MKTSYILVLTLVAIRVHAASMLEILECHDKVISNGAATLSVPKEVQSILGATNVDHFISEFGTATPVWNSVGYFEGRYTFSLKLPIKIDYEKCKVIEASGSVFVQINETVKVEISTSGVAGAVEKGQWRLNGEQWKLLVANKGDWSTVQIPILTNSPVAGFDEYERQVRAPIRDRKKGFDDVIRKTLADLRKQQADKSNAGKKIDSDLKPGPPPKGAACYDELLRQGMEASLLPREVESLFGTANVDHLISKPESATQTPVWHSVAYFSGRYRLLLQFPILIDHDKCKFKGAINSAMVQIDEIAKVEISKDGVAKAAMKGQWRLNENEWKWLVKNKGDWSVVKVPILTNAPVKGFDEYVQQERARPVGTRQEDFDKPIRQVIDALRYPGVGSDRK